MIHEHVTMPIGKYKAQRIGRLPTSYLLWAAAKLHWKYPQLVASILAILAQRLADLPAVVQELAQEPDPFRRRLAEIKATAECKERETLGLLYPPEELAQRLEGVRKCP